MDFRTDRLNAERLSAVHLGDLTDLRLDPEVCRFLGGIRSAEQTDEYLKTNLTHWDKHGFTHAGCH